MSFSIRFTPGQLSQQQYSLRRDLASSEEMKKLYATPEFQTWAARRSRKAAARTLYTTCAVAVMMLLCLLAACALTAGRPQILAHQVQHVSTLARSSPSSFGQSALQCQYIFTPNRHDRGLFLCIARGCYRSHSCTSG